MEKVTFFESIVKILKTISSVPFFIEMLLLTFVLLIVMIFFYFRKSKKGKMTTLIIYFTTLILLPISHISFFVDLMDKIIENFVKIIYFPSWYIYLIMLIITDVSVLKELIKAIKEEKTKWINALNFAYFFIFQFLFFLIVRIVSTNDMNIFESSELYSNSLLLSVIQISSYLFWIRAGIKIIIFIINKLSNFEFKKKEQEIKNVYDETHNLENDGSLDEYNNEASNFISNDNILNSDNVSDKDLDFIEIIDNTPVIDNKVYETNLNNSVHSDLNNNFNNSLYDQESEKIEILNFDLDKNDDSDNDNYFDDFYG